MIKDSPEWLEDPFHFRLYPGSISCNKKGVMAFVLMVEIKRDNVSLGLDFFCNTFDGENPLSPCSIPQLFFTLYHNQLSDAERHDIIQDAKFHIGNTQLIHLYGLQDVDTPVTLRQNITIHLWKLLSGLCAHQTNHRLFIQIEKEADPDVIICAFYSVDHDLVMSNTPHLSSYIHQCIKESDYAKVYVNDDLPISFSTKSIPLKKGSFQVSSRPVPIEIQEHASLALSKMVKQPEKQPSPSASSIMTNSTLTSSPSSRPSNSSNPSYATMVSMTNTLPAGQWRFQAIEQRLKASATHMDSIENLCRQLKSNTDVITQKLH